MKNEASTSNQALETRAPLVCTEAERPWAQHLIFLSHSGKQKPFVLKLDHALREAGHNPFLDIHSLPLGEPFPDHICKSATKCKLGVVVISHAFLTSYWPMAELNILSNPPAVCRILPLFYDIHFNDVKRSSPRFSEWQEAWRKTADLHPSRVNINEWENATAQLPILGGLAYNQLHGEDFFIKKVIRRICDLVRPPLRYDFSLLSGHERLTQEVISLFNKVHTSTHVKTRAIGFYAINGQGKTTICKLMVDHYTYDCAGRCTIIEFPSDDCNEKQIVQLCKKALRQLMTSMDKRTIKAIDSFDQCVKHMKDRLADNNVFIALDNVGEKSSDYAQRILDVVFNTGSKILVTSQSKQVLSTLLKDGKLVMPLPSLNKEEARQVFKRYFNRNRDGQGSELALEDSYVDDVTKIYKFECGYHPAAIIALGVNLAKVGVEALQERLSSLALEDVEDKLNELIRVNFDSLSKKKKLRDLFLDVTLIYIPYVKGSFTVSARCAFFEESGKRRVYFEELLLILWLSFLHRMGSADIEYNLKKLQYAGLLDFEHGFRNVSVHDLYKNLVTREAFESGRFVLPMKDSSLHQGTEIRWADVARVVWSEYESSESGVSKALHNWSSEPVPTGVLLPLLNFLWINEERSHLVRSAICDLKYMQDLRVLNVKNGLIVGDEECCYPSTTSWVTLISVSVSDLNVADLSHRELRVLDLSDMTIDGSLSLEGLANLQLFFLTKASVEKIKGLDGLNNLKYMSLSCVQVLQEVGVFGSRCSQLQVLEIKGCPELRRIEGLGGVPNVRRLEVTECPMLELSGELPGSLQTLVLKCRMERQPVLSGMMRLEEVVLRFEVVQVEAVEIEGLPYLTSVELQGKVGRISSISDLPKLKHLKLADCSEMREFNWAALRNLPSLESLHIEALALEEVVGRPTASIRTLQYLSIIGKNLNHNFDASRYLCLGATPSPHFHRRPRRS